MSIGREVAGVHRPARAWPPTLRRGDRVRVVAPSGPVRAELLERGVALLESWGLDVRCGDHVLDRTASGMLAGEDDVRAGDLMVAWTDPDATAVLCARGGYGAGRILELLDWAALRAAGPKWLVGSSDATALHQAFGAALDLVTAFGPMPATEPLGAPEASPASAEALHDLLFGAPLALTAALAPLPAAVRGGVAEGRLVGGNLTLLASAVGTAHSDPAGQAVAFLEDVGEQPYRVDRMLTQLLQAGWFAGVRGIALGTWEGCGDVLPVLSERLGGLGVPVLAGLPVGHGPHQQAVPLGAVVRLDTGAGTLTALRG